PRGSALMVAEVARGGGAGEGAGRSTLRRRHVFDAKASVSDAGLLPGRLQATFWPADHQPVGGRMVLWGVPEVAEALAEAGLPEGDPVVLRTVAPRSPRARTRVRPADVPARAVPVLEAAAA